MKANLLPPQAYTEQSYFIKEQTALFSNCWSFAGLVEDVSEGGDFITVQAGLNNLIVYLDESGKLQAVHNICRHRGMRLVDGAGKFRSKITCPYHDWTYDLTGKLKSLPKHREDFVGLDKACLSLKQAKVGCWRDMLWVHPHVDAPELSQYFESMVPYVAPYDVDALIESPQDIVEVTIAANWKLVAENYIDHYHLAHLHSGTLAMYDHKRAEFGFVGDHFHFWEPLSTSYKKDINKNAPLPLIIDANHERIGAWVPLLFPCTGLAESESSWSVFHIIPQAVDKTKVVIRTKVKSASMFQFLSQAAKSANFWSSKTKAKISGMKTSHPLGSADFMQEDIYVCEQLQKSLSSPFFEFGPSAEQGESPIRGFQKRLMEKVDYSYIEKSR